MRRGLVIALFVVLVAPASAWARQVEVVVLLEGPGLAQARAESRALSPAAKRVRLDPSTGPSRAYLGQLSRAQAAFEARLARKLPVARVHRRYRLVLNAMALALPERELPRLAGIAGVAEVVPSVSYRRLLDRGAPLIGAPTLWALPEVEAGAGAKIGIIDDGVDPSHPFFSPSGYTMPPGFPKGQTALTSAKVIAARAFAPAGVAWPNARRAFDPDLSEHGTHVAGIAAGNAGTLGPGGVSLAGVAPRAHLGNYKVLSVPTGQFGLNGNAPEIAAGIEAAVADGMDVLNLSLGQPEIEPTRDLVALAITGAAAAGVPTVAAAGNDFGSFGLGSVGSPGSVAASITAASVSTGRSGTAGAISGFSSAGPTPVSLRLKPDVAAPGGAVLSSVPGGWALLSGTSMAAPHVAGGIALLRRHRPGWTPEQLRSALVTTAAPVGSPLRTGGGLVSLPAAASPLLFAEPSVLSFGLVRPGQLLRASVRLSDAGGGAGTWTLGDRAVSVPGTLEVSLQAPSAQGEVTGRLTLRRGEDERRVPYWFRVAAPRLPKPTARLTKTGTYRGSTVARPARVLRYRYPDRGPVLRGPEQVFRVALPRPVANFGVAVLSGAVQPRVVHAGDENRLVGYAGLPLNLNPYLDRIGSFERVAGAIRPRAGAYDIVFDSTRRGARFSFRFWVNDTTPPTARLVSGTASGGVLRIRVADAGSGVDPRSLVATVNGQERRARLVGGVAHVDVRGLARGRHSLTLRVSDHQEAKNMENVLRILPNTRFLDATFRIP